jgi:hypothetical protein
LQDFLNLLAGISQVDDLLLAEILFHISVENRVEFLVGRKAVGVPLVGP